MRVNDLIKILKDCNPKAIVDIQVENKLVICDWEMTNLYMKMNGLKLMMCNKMITKNLFQ